jgi:hypothetical protein
MGVRSVRDASGIEWQVWEVRPSWAGRQTPMEGMPAVAATRPSLAPHLEGGWLTFQSPQGERRRIVPIPTGWEALDEPGLLRLLTRADVQPRSNQRLIE